MADEVVQDIAVKQEKKNTVLEAGERIYTLFKVLVSLSVESAGIQWVQLKGLKENTEFAKTYINSLCSPEFNSKVPFPEHLFQELSEFKDVVEQDSRAVVVFTSTKDAIVQGSEISVVIATSAIEQKIKELESKQNGVPTNNSNSYVEQEKVQSVPVSKIDPSLKEFAMKLGYTEDAIQQVLKKQAGKEVDQNILLRELISVSSPSLLQKGKSSDSAVPSPSTQGLHHRTEVFSHGLSAFMPNPNVVAKSWGPKDKTAHRGEVVARGPPAQYIPTGTRPTIQKSWPQEPNSFEQFDRTKYVERQQEDEPFLYNQVVGDSGAALDSSSDLRHIVIDGSNVAMSHGNQQVFSCRGIKLCIEYFKQRGHNDITVFVPQWRKETPRPDAPIRNQEILTELEQQRFLSFTPSRKVNGRRIVCYDDRFILRLADETDGIIVSNDNFRDLFKENPKWQEVIEQRILMYSFVNDRFMVPDDPLGRHGPKIDDFLRKGTASHKRICPYLKRCTYGLRCRYYHPERDPNRNGQEVKKQVDYRHRVQDQNMAWPHVDMHARSRGHNGIQAYPPYGYQYGGQQGMHFIQGQVREGPLELERHFTSSTPEAIIDRDGTLATLRNIFPDSDELINQVMRDNPNASVHQLADILAPKMK